MRVRPPIVSFTIPGPPYAQKRARASTKGGKFATVYDPKENVSWKGVAQHHMLEAMKALEPEAIFTEPVRLTITAVFPLPVGKYRKRNPRPRELSRNAKDVDNIAKAVMDAGTGILYVDDRQVVRLVVEKWVGAQGEAPGVHVHICEVTDD